MSTQQKFLDALSAALTADDGAQLRAAADALLSAAAAGKPWALQMLADRLDGKPAQQALPDTRPPQIVIVTGVPGTPTTVLNPPIDAPVRRVEDLL